MACWPVYRPAVQPAYAHRQKNGLDVFDNQVHLADPFIALLFGKRRDQQRHAQGSGSGSTR